MIDRDIVLSCFSGNNVLYLQGNKTLNINLRKCVCALVGETAQETFFIYVKGIHGKSDMNEMASVGPKV